MDSDAGLNLIFLGSELTFRGSPWLIVMRNFGGIVFPEATVGIELLTFRLKDNLTPTLTHTFIFLVE